jgi:G:T-mismatch repair DNA endonuclease (very short patch repair protein)
MAPRTIVRRKSRGRVSTKIIRKANRTRKASGLELEIHAMMKAEKIPFTKEKTIGRCHADIFIEPNKVIELNGCYWHYCTRCQKKPPSVMHKKAMASDSRRLAFFQRLGFEVHVIWECDVKNDPEKVQARLKKISGK